MKMIDEKYLQLKRLVDIYYDVQDVRIRTENRLRLNVPSETRGTYPKSLKDIEEGLKLEIMQSLQAEPVWIQFLSKWRGLGACLGGGLVANISVRFVKREPLNDMEKTWALTTKNREVLVPEKRGIEAFDTPSKLWAFCGLSVNNGKALKRAKGETISWSPKMRMLCWKIGEQFVKQGRYYREIYEHARQTYEARKDLQEGKGAKGHRYAMAKRKMVKQFMLDLWIAWRKLEGLSTRQPYVIEKLGHSHYQSPPALGDREETETFKPPRM